MLSRFILLSKYLADKRHRADRSVNGCIREILSFAATLRRAWYLLLILMLLPACSGPAGAAVPPTLSSEAALGQEVFTRECGSCHSTMPDTIIVGPSLAGIARQAGSRVPGQDAPTYLLNAIINPGDYLVEGFQDLMPANFGKKLTGEEIDAVIAYLMTLE